MHFCFIQVVVHTQNKDSSPSKRVFTPAPHASPSLCSPVPLALFAVVLVPTSTASLHPRSEPFHFPTPSFPLLSASLVPSTPLIIVVRPSRRHKAHLKSAVAKRVNMRITSQSRTGSSLTRAGGLVRPSTGSRESWARGRSTCCRNRTGGAGALGCWVRLDLLGVGFLRLGTGARIIQV